MFFAGGPGRPIPLHDYIQESLEDIDEPRSVRAGFAYATEDGISQLCSSGSGSDWRDQTSSKWLIGLDQGITEPSALENLSSRGDTEVRAIYPGSDLTREALYRRPRFHAKIVFLESDSSDGHEHLVTTSANMTGSALGRVPTNYEVGLVKSRDSGLTDEEVENFEDWWELAWSEADPVTSELIDSYSEIREDFQQANPDVREYESPETVHHASDADHLWIETLKMTAGARNQLELTEECTSFFAPSGALPEEVDIRCGGTPHPDCTLTTRVTDPPFGVRIGLLYLPTDYDYPYKVVHLERVDSDSGGNPEYEMEVADPSDDVVDDWKTRASNQGVRGETRGGREWGFY